MTTDLKPGERLDDLQIKGYEIIQHPGRFCFGMDAVLLSAFARIKTGESVLDLGTGTGILPILFAAKTEGRQFTGLEIQEESVDMARRSVRHNRLEERIRIVAGDIRRASDLFGVSSFDVVTANPPYMVGGHGLLNPESAKAIARHEVLCTLEELLRESARVIRPRGRLYLVHRPFRLAEILSGMQKYALEPKRMRLVYPYVDKEPNLVLLEGVHGGAQRMRVEPPLIIFQKDGSYTEEVRRYYGMDS